MRDQTTLSIEHHWKAGAAQWAEPVTRTKLWVKQRCCDVRAMLDVTVAWAVLRACWGSAIADVAALHAVQWQKECVNGWIEERKVQQ